MMLKQIAIAAVASVALLTGTAHAGLFTSGSISILASTSTQTDLGSTTVFTFDPAVFGPNDYFLTSGAGDFGAFAPIHINVNPITAFDMGNAASFSFNASAAGFGSFAATGITNVNFS